MLVSSLCFIICSNAVAHRRDKSVLYARTLMTVFICCLIISYNSYHLDFLSSDVGIFHGQFHITPLVIIFHIFIFFICGLIIQLYGFYPRKLSFINVFNPLFLLTMKLKYFNSFILNKMSEQFKILEYPLLILFVITGGVFLIACSDLISIFLSIELQSYGLYILCSVYKDSEKATSAGLTYFLLGGLSSCFILFASAIIYSNLGNTNFDNIYVLCSLHHLDFNSNMLNNYDYMYINIAFAIMSVGFLFKVTAAPFHFWSPDVYDAIPTSVTTFVAIFAKISIFILLLELIYYTNTGNIYGDDIYNSSWKITLLLSSLCSFVIGSVLGMIQSRVKRLYAYSTISHVGFILLGISINSIESIQSFVFYLMQYSLSNLNAFILLIAMGYTLYTCIEKNTYNESNKIVPEISDKKNSPIQLINQLTGFFYINPVLSLSFGLTIFSFVGVPPLIGFFGKQMVLSSALDNGYVFITLVAILTSVVSAYYYLSLVKQIFFSQSNYMKNPQIDNLNIKCDVVKGESNIIISNVDVRENNIVISSHMSVTISVLTLIITLFIISPQEWLSMINILSVILFNN